MIQAIVFDFDGLIFDTETHEYKALQEIFTEYEAELPLDVWGKCVGTRAGTFNAYAYLEQCIGRTVDRDALAKLRREKYERLIGEEKIRDGVEDYLNAARKLGLKIGLASSSTRPWVVGHLEKLGILHYFECIHTAEDVEQVKPDPALYIKTLQCLGVKPEQAIAFEDSPNGALAAKRAGMYCVIVPNFVTETLPFHTIDIRLQSMAEIALEQLLDKIASSSET